MRYFATAEEMERLDKLAVKHGLLIGQMMELAGWHMAALFLKLKVSKKKQGSRSNGAGKIVAADIGISAFLYDKIKKGSRPSF